MATVTPLTDLLTRQVGVLTVQQAVDGLGPDAVRWRLRTRRWQRCYPRVLLTHSGPPCRDQQLWAALLHCGPDAVLSRETAAALGGLVGYEDDQIHVTVPAHRHPVPVPGVVVRRSTQLAPGSLQSSRLPRRTTIERSILDAAAFARTDDRAAALVLASVQQGLTRPDRLADVLATLPKQPRRRLLRHVLADAAGGVHSLPEREFGALIRAHHLPLPTRQGVRLDGCGRRRYVDAEWDQFATRVEIDGGAHREVGQWWSDLERENRLQLAGRSTVLRFPAYAVRHRQTYVATTLERALRQGGWAGR